MLLIRHGQSEFNVVYSVTRQDPGIRDPKLTVEGRAEARVAAGALAEHRVDRLVTSPYTRALETAEIIARILDLPISVDPRVGERAAFACDVGSPVPHWGFIRSLTGLTVPNSAVLRIDPRRRELPAVPLHLPPPASPLETGTPRP